MSEPSEGQPRIYIPNPRWWKAGVTKNHVIRRRLRKLLETQHQLETHRGLVEEQRKRAKARLWEELPNGFLTSVRARHDAYEARYKELHHLDRLIGKARAVRDLIERKWLP